MKQKKKKANTANTPNEFAAERAARGQASQPESANQLGATEQDVQPLTPPAAESPDKQPPLPRKRYAEDVEDALDPADELTPG